MRKIHTNLHIINDFIHISHFVTSEKKQHYIQDIQLNVLGYQVLNYLIITGLLALLKSDRIV